jgi:putative selenium metabolism protein SsnA
MKRKPPDSDDSLLIENGTIVTLGEPPRLLSGHALLVRRGRIAALRPRGEIDGNGARVIDAGGQLVLPGLINAHMHFYSTLVRGLGKAKPARDFNQILENLWWRLDRVLTLEDCHISAQVMMLAAIRHGTTTLFDHHASSGAVRGSLAAIARAAQATGLRVSLAYEVSDRDGARIAGEGLEENADFIRSCNRSGGDQVKAMFGLHAAFTLSDETLAAAAASAGELGAGCHIHVAEAESDQLYGRRRHGLSVVERLARAGVLGPRAIAAHCVHLDGAEMERLAESGAMAVHNPQSNLNNGVGIADLVALARHGVLVGLGTDAMTVNMLEEVRVALWAQHLRHGPAHGFAEAAATLFINNPRLATRLWGEPLGVLAEGALADIILVDYDPPTELSESTLFGHLLFGVSQAAVDTTIVRGSVLMAQKKLALDLDEARIAARSRELAAALWQRF